MTAHDFADAFAKAEALARLEKRLVDEYEARVEEAADMQQEYRHALAVAHVQAAADPELKTAVMREAHAQELASDAERAAAVTDGMVKATLARLRAVEMDQAMLNALISWSVAAAYTNDRTQLSRTSGTTASDETGACSPTLGPLSPYDGCGHPAGPPTRTPLPAQHASVNDGSGVPPVSWTP